MFKLWIISACFTIVIADDFVVINCPDALAFDASTTTLPLKQLKYTLMTIVGEDASANGEFSALKINNIFKLPKLAFIATIKLDTAADYAALGTVNKYSLEGRARGATLNSILDFEKYNARQAFNNISRAIDFVRLEGQLIKCKVPEAKQITHELQSLLTAGGVEHIIVDMKAKNFVAIHLFNDKAALDFDKLANSIKKLKEFLTDTFYAILTYGPDATGASNQSISFSTIIDPIEFKQHNIAPFYDENYTIIFNIILWFMIAFGLSLLAVIMALVNMDPGRDSIIYRMTATRSKKDV